MAKQKTVKVTDAHGNTAEVPVGLDGKNPVSPNNPSPKALVGEAEVTETAKEDAKADTKADTKSADK